MFRSSPMSGLCSAHSFASAAVLCSLLAGPLEAGPPGWIGRLAQGAVPEGMEFPELLAALPVGRGVLQPCLGELEGKIRCGRFRVLETRDEPTGRTLDLAFVLADPAGALDRETLPQTALTFLLGGPGSSATRQVRSILTAFAPLRDRRSMLFIDSRGVGASGDLACNDPYPGGAPSRFGTIFPLDHLDTCRKRLAERVDLRQYHSVAAMDDLEQLRAWLDRRAEPLGEPRLRQLDFYAGSYGTREAQVFVRRHPSSVRSLVLMAAKPITKRAYLSHARGLEQALERLTLECSRDDGCRRAYPELSADIERLFVELREGPVTVKVTGESAAGEAQNPETTVRFGAGDLGYALRGLLYQRGAELPWMVHRARSGDWRPVAEYYLGRQAWVGEAGGSTGYHLSAICAEDIARVTDQEVADETAGTFLGSHLIDSYRAACERWSHADLGAEFFDEVHSTLPTLILSGTHDPVTPPADGAALTRTFTNSKHVVVEGAGHGVFGPCIFQMERALYDTAEIEALDDSCLEARDTAIEFRLPE